MTAQDQFGESEDVSTPAPPVYRTPDERFAGLVGYPFEPHYVQLRGLRMHYLDEGPGTVGTLLLLHGEPSWSFLYRNLIPTFVAAGYRCIAPDMIGFGRSDKVTDPAWYTLDTHVGMLRGLVEALDLQGITLVCQDWGGPVGLINAVDMPDRFARLVILNTWLHRTDFPYTPALHAWHERSQSVDFSRMGAGPWVIGSPDPVEVLQAGYGAPFPAGAPEAQTGAFRWPAMLPFANPVDGAAARQEAAYRALATWDKPAHVIFGALDQVFPPSWGQEFANHIPGATFDVVDGLGHMVQEAGAPLADLILRRISGN